MSTQTSEYWKLFRAKNCNLKLRADAKDDVIEEIVVHLEKNQLLQADLGGGARKALLDRERLASTGMGMNVAIPHVKLEGLDEVVVSVSLHPEGVEWEATDGEPVKILFTVLRPARASDAFDPERHLDMMRWLSGLCRKADFRRFALAASNRKEICDLLKEMSDV